MSIVERGPRARSALGYLSAANLRNLLCTLLVLFTSASFAAVPGRVEIAYRVSSGASGSAKGMTFSSTTARLTTSSANRRPVDSPR